MTRIDEPIEEIAWRRASIVRIGIVAAFFVANLSARPSIAAGPDRASFDAFLAISTAAQVVVALTNAWALRARPSERAWRKLNYASAACESLTVVLGVWLSGSYALSFNVLWCLILIGVYRVYFDAALGRFVTAAICVLDVALVALQAQGVVALVPIHDGPYASLSAPTGPVVALARLVATNVIVLVLASYTARRIRTSENALRDWNARLEDRVRAQVSQLEREGRLRRYLAPQLVDKILGSTSDPVALRERRHVTVMFADLRGFTALVERADPDAVADVLNAYFDEVATIAFSYGGTIDKFIGDAVMVFFGAPEATGDADQARRCVRMAIAIQARMRERAPALAARGGVSELSVRIGIGSGIATVGAFGTRHRSDYTVVGSPVNRAARIEPLAPPGEVLVDEETATLVRDAIDLDERGEVALKGFAAPVRVYRVRGVSRR